MTAACNQHLATVNNPSRNSSTLFTHQLEICIFCTHTFRRVSFAYQADNTLTKKPAQRQPTDPKNTDTGFAIRACYC